MNPVDELLTIAVVLAAAALLSLERLAYALAWTQPDRFAREVLRLGFRDAVAGLEAAFLAFKLLQAAVFAGWCAWFGGVSGWTVDFGTASVAAGSALIVAGQILNAAVFVRLGRIGVFYGSRFGYFVPWRVGFPFSLMRHPQYAGTVMTIWGIFLIARFPHDDWLVLPLIETVYYTFGAHVERAGEISAARAVG